jgi:acetyl esterase/lipase
VHGGGFVSGSSAECSKYLLQLFLELSQRGIVCDILSVDYDLAPSAIYPTAMRQIIQAYRYATGLHKPIILMGDSAGGNLCLGLLQHLAFPNPVLEFAPHAGATLENEIVATCLLSPWVNLRTEGSSVQAYKQFDCVDKAQLDQWARDYLGPNGALDCYNNPIDREKGWNSILTHKILFLAGGMELFLSDILGLVHKIRGVSYRSLE